MKKLYEGLHVGTCRIDYPNSISLINFFFAEFLDLRAHVWGIREYTPLTDYDIRLKDTVPRVSRTRLALSLQKRGHLCPPCIEMLSYVHHYFNAASH